MQAQDMTMSDYAGIIRRRWRPAAIAAVLVAFSAVFLAYHLPAVYESLATIQIEQQQMPDELVQTTISGYADQFLQSVRQRVLATPIVTEVIQELDLYPEDHGTLSMEELVTRFRDNSGMVPLNVTTTQTRTGRPADITYAFQVSFRYSDAVQARNVVQELTKLWLQQNESLRVEAAGRTTQFLDAEVERMKERLAETQERLAEFKERYADSLPDARLLNLQSQERLERELTDVENQLRATRERKALLEGELAETPRFRPVLSETGEPVLGGADRLALLQQELIIARGRYSDNHPDVVRLRREIAALSDEAGSQSSMAQQLRSSLESNRRELEVALERLSPDHPDVVRLQRTVSSLEEQLAQLEREGGGAAPSASANNPPYLQLQTRIRTAETELQDLSRRRADLVRRLGDIDRRVSQSPQVEREFASLSREHELLVAEYQALRTKQAQAARAETLESGDTGERLRVIEPASLPSSPVQPNRAALSFLGIILALAAGLGVVSLAEATDSTVRGRRDVNALLEMPPLAIIPFIETRADRMKRLVRNSSVALVAVVAVGVLYGKIVGI